PRGKHPHNIGYSLGVRTISVKGREMGGCPRNDTQDEEEGGFLRNPPTTQNKIVCGRHLGIPRGRGAASGPVLSGTGGRLGGALRTSPIGVLRQGVQRRKCKADVPGSHYKPCQRKPPLASLRQAGERGGYRGWARRPCVVFSTRTSATVATVG